MSQSPAQGGASGGDDEAIERRMLDWLDGREAAMVEELRVLVDLSTGPSELDGRRQAIHLLAKRYQAIGLRAEILEAAGGLCHLFASRQPAPPVDGADASAAPKVLILGHVDTVHDAANGFVGMARVGEHLHGPGVADMKGGLVVAATAIQAVARAGRLPRLDLRVLLTSDEEVGSPTSRALIERLCEGCDAVLDFEPGRPGFAVVTGRAAVGAFRVEVAGAAAHAGAAPGEGRSAIIAAADLCLRLGALTDADAAAAGSCLNVGTIAGGTARNVVAERCVLEIDARARTAAEVTRLEAGLRAAAAAVEAATGVRVTVRGRFHRPPWPMVDASADPLLGLLRGAARDLGLPLPAIETSGGSDANFTAALGIPTVDGLGPVGTGYHAPEERIERASLVERAKLVALALLRLRRATEPVVSA